MGKRRSARGKESAGKWKKKKGPLQPKPEPSAASSFGREARIPGKKESSRRERANLGGRNARRKGIGQIRSRQRRGNPAENSSLQEIKRLFEMKGGKNRGLNVEKGKQYYF